MTRKARSHDVLGKLSAFSMAVILLLSIFVPMFASTIEVSAAKSSYDGAIYVDFSKNSTWLAYAGTGRVKVNGSSIEKESGGLYKTKTSGFTGDTITVEYSYSIPNQENRLFYKGSYTYAYFWQDGGASDLNGPWPGMSMDEFDTNKYYCDYNSVADSVIFNDSQGGHQTGNLTIGKTNNVYDDSSDTWQAYNEADWTKTYTATLNLSDRPGNYANTIYMDASGNVQWSRYDHSKDNPYTGTTGEEPVTVKLYAPDWDNQAHVMYDLNDPMANVGVSYTGTGTVAVDGKDYEYFILKVPKNSVFKFYKSSANSGTGQLTVPSDNDTLYYSLVMNDWVTKENLENNEKYDILVSANNFANPSGGVSGGGSVIGVDAMYFDYLSDNERTSGWRQNLNDENYTANYRMQFSNFNNLIKQVALDDISWRYPMFFGDDYNAQSYIDTYWGNIGSRYGSTQGYFQAVNNANYLNSQWMGDWTSPSGDSERSRSVQGLVNSSLSNAKLTVGTGGTLAPYFNYDLLHNNAGGTGGTGGGETQLQIKTESLGTHSNHDYYKITLPRKYTKIIINNNNGSQTKNLSISTDISGKIVYAKSEQDNFYGGRSGCPSSSYDDNYWYIVVENEANWTDVYAHYWKSDSDSTGTSFPGVDIKGNYTYSDPDSGSSGSSSGTGAYAKVISAKFPFVATKDATTGVTTYSFDSTNATDNVYFNWDNGVPTQVNYGTGTGYGVNNKGKSTYGIFPFNNKDDLARDYGFGIKMKTYFTLPENGVYGDVDNTPIIRTEQNSEDAFLRVIIPKASFDGNTVVSVNGGTASSKLSEISGKVFRPNAAESSGAQPSDWGRSKIDDEYYYVVLNRWNGNERWSDIYLKFDSNNMIKVDGSSYNATTFAQTSATNQHAKFEYSGDDDLWVFIDGQLVLDLGGAHMPTRGSIDFGYAPGKIKATADKVYLQVNGGENGTTDTPKNGDKVGTEFKFNNQDTSVRHEMVVYYMERGTNDSNLKVEFSIQPVTNDLRIDKTVDVSDVNDGLKDAAKTADNFTFITSQSGTQKAQDTFGNGKGVLYSASDKNLTTNESMTIAETYSGNLNYTTESFVEDINAQQQITSTGNNESLSFNYINAKNQTDINTSLSAHFTNRTVTQPLTVKKYLVDKNGAEITDSNIDFNFVIGVSLDGTENYSQYPLTYRLYDRNKNAVLNSDGINLYTAVDGKFKLKAGYYAKFEGVPEGANYQITEENLLPGYTFENAQGATKGAGDYCTGSIAATGNEVVVTNKFQPIESALTAFKNLDGRPYTGLHFKFTQTLLYCSNTTNVPSSDYDKYADNVIDVSNGNVTFKNVQYDYVGDYFYSIRESLSNTAPTDEYVMDETIYYAKVAVTKDENNQLQAAITYYQDYNVADHTVKNEITGVPTFNNTTATKYTDVSFTKQDENGSPLSGAEFTLYTDAACTTEGTIATVSKADSGFTNPATSAENTGLVTFSQLKYEPSKTGDVKATYYFKETKAPNGYQLLTGTFKIEIATDGNYKIYYDNRELTPIDKTYVVNNIKQPELPIAGGVGVTMFYVLGALAVVIAGTAFVLYKKRINVIALAAQLIHRK